LVTVSNEALGALSATLTIISIAPYYYGIINNTAKPHAFSWLIWGMLSFIAFCAQTIKGAGPGAWGAGAASVSCFSVGILAFFKGEKNITLGDKIALTGALLALPCWYVTRDPLTAVILISLIDVVGYYPTFRKSYQKPCEELIYIYALGTIINVVTILAMENFALVTWLYPATVAIANAALALMLIIRRRMIKKVGHERT